jgi:transcriptional regulator with XRE-family HTH domain
MTLQQIFIANLKDFRQKKGLSQMTLAELCDTSGNYISEIEMGRRIPSFEKIEKIAGALEIASYQLFMQETAEKYEEIEQKAGYYLENMPQKTKKEIALRLLAAIRKDIDASLDARNY